MPKYGFWSAAALGLLLGGCNWPTAAVVAMASSGADVETPRPGLSVSFQPGLPLFQAATEAPTAFLRLRGAAARINLEKLALGDATALLTGEILSGGVLLPIPAGVLSIRTIAPEAAPVRVIPVMPATDGSDATPTRRRQLPEVIGVYGSGQRTLILATDGTFVIKTAGAPVTVGMFYLHGEKLELDDLAHGTHAFAPVGNDNWLGMSGEMFSLVHEDADSKPHATRVRGSR